ncbi:hypothetical protein ScPMuIL_011651 [Solemya velum]
MSYIEKTKEAQLVLFCWGEDNNDSNTIKTLKEQGVNGVIYDKWMVQDGNKSETWEVSSEFSPLKNVQFKEKTYSNRKVVDTGVAGREGICDGDV